MLAKKRTHRQRIIDCGRRMHLNLRYRDFYRYGYDPERHGDLEHLDTKNTSLLGALTVIERHALIAQFVKGYDQKTLIAHCANRRSYRIRWIAESEELEINEGIKQHWLHLLRDKRTRFLVAFLSVFCEKYDWHANVIIYDKQGKELEIFDPMGCEVSRWFKAFALYDKLFKLMRDEGMVFRGTTLVVPPDYCQDQSVFQGAELDEPCNMGLRGACAAWRLWWIDMRLTNPDVPPAALAKTAMEFLQAKKAKNGVTLTVFIRKYQKYILRCIDDRWPKREVKTSRRSASVHR